MRRFAPILLVLGSLGCSEKWTTYQDAEVRVSMPYELGNFTRPGRFSIHQVGGATIISTNMHHGTYSLSFAPLAKKDHEPLRLAEEAITAMKGVESARQETTNDIWGRFEDKPGEEFQLRCRVKNGRIYLWLAQGTKAFVHSANTVIVFDSFE